MTLSSTQVQTAVKAFASIPSQTLPSFQVLDPGVLDKMSRELSEREDNYVTESDMASFLQWHGATGTDIEKLFKTLDMSPTSNPREESKAPIKQFMIALSVLGPSDWSEKIPILFQVFDTNQDGVLQRSEFEYAMVTLFKVAAELSNPNLNLGPYSKTRATIEATAKYVTESTFNEADLDGDEVLNAAEFANWIHSGNESAILIKTIIEAVGPRK